MNKCAYCERTMLPRSAGPDPLARTRDHYIPLSRGGLNVSSNFRPACNACNQIKGNMMPDEWKQYMLDNPMWWTKQINVKPKKASAAALRSMTTEENARRIEAYLAEHGETIFPEDAKYKITYGKKAYLRWVASGRPTPPYNLRPLRKGEPFPKNFDDPKQQEAWERVMENRRFLIWVPKENSLSGLPQGERRGNVSPA